MARANASTSVPDRSFSSLSLPEPSADSLTQLAQAALRYVKDGQTIGLGSGRAAHAFIRAVAAAGLDIRGIPTSSATSQLARSLKIQLANLDEVSQLDAVFDGADEVDTHLDMVKGRGGALVREKVVALAARRRIFLVWDTKMVKRLGEHGILPIEVVPFAAPVASRLIAKLALRPKVRLNAKGHQFLSDNGNLILDCSTSAIRNPTRLERDLLAVPGVVGTGLFLGIAHIVLVLSRDRRIITLRRPR
jgi:ribose 5-phosphate isomerase A